jgi:hypothetical protein
LIFLNGAVTVWQFKQFAEEGINEEAYLPKANAVKFRARRLKKITEHCKWLVQYTTLQH